MPLFEKKSERVNATRRWVGDVRFALELDLSRHALSGVRVGGVIDGLMRMGPAEDPSAAEAEVYRWLSRGVEVTCEDGFVTAIRILWEETEGFLPFPGRCTYAGEEIELTANTTESVIIELMGDPFWRDRDHDETLLFYEFGAIEWQIEITRNGHLAQWTILSPPLMASAEQRQAYGVTRAWPPPSPGRIRPRISGSLLKGTQ